MKIIFSNISFFKIKAICDIHFVFWLNFRLGKLNKQNIQIKKLFILYLHHYVSFVSEMLEFRNKKSFLSFIQICYEVFLVILKWIQHLNYYDHHLLRSLLLLSHTLSNCVKTISFCWTICAFFWASCNSWFRFFNSNSSS